MWEKGHSFREIDEMTIEDVGYVLGYWEETNLIEKRRAQTRKNLSGKGKR